MLHQQSDIIFKNHSHRFTYSILEDQLGIDYMDDREYVGRSDCQPEINDHRQILILKLKL
jgi:hypothetical protein